MNLTAQVDDDIIYDIVIGMARSPCRFLIPLAYNDGREVEPEKFLEIKRALDRQFGAYRIVNEFQQGSWCGQVEGVMEIEVAIPQKRCPELKALVIAIGADLGQKAMYLNCPPPSVYIIDVETGEENEDDED